MPVVSPSLVAHVLADLLGQALVRDVAVVVPGLGTFERRHRPGALQPPAGAQATGRPALVPPRDEVGFIPERL